MLVIFGLVGACNLHLDPAPPLTAEAARQTLDQWNPQYCKVVEFYGFRQSAGDDARLAYVLLANPKEPAAKPILSVAQFQLLIRPDGSREWFLTSLLSHSNGLTRRQGWDNLLIQVKNKPLTVKE
ncbi:MAG: hypothetical protein ACUVXF_08325 [Desulfobaccales bacterium]